MAVATADTKLWTTADLLAFPDDGVERYIIRGKLHEIHGDEDMTLRNRYHSTTMACIVGALQLWLDAQPQPRGVIVCGEAGCELATTPTTTVGIDVAFYTAEQWSAQPSDSTIMIGTPKLAVEINSPRTTNDQINEKIATYLAAQCPLIWVVEPRFRHVTVYRPDAPTQLFAVGSDLTAEPHLPGFCVAVRRLFP